MAEQTSKVLIVDDIRTNVEFIRDILDTVDHVESMGVYNGREALEAVKSFAPDLILLDVAMPELDGFEVCRRLKKDPAYSDIPIIFLTARVQKEDIIEGFETGAVDYIAKPFNLTELLQRVQTQLELRHKTRALQAMNLQLEEKVAERTDQLIRANEKLSEANAKLSEALDELSGLDHAKNEFISHINHELRTPLNGIMGYTSLLAEVTRDEESKKYLEAINELVSRLTRVSEITLLLTELKAVNNKINLRPVQLQDEIERALYREDLAGKDIRVKFHRISDPSPVAAELRLVNTCISIILDNAIKYSPKSGTINIYLRDNRDFMSVDIVDEGPGFSDAVKQQIFELFLADNLEHRSHGFGIGLAAARLIMELLGGEIAIDNCEKGAAVSLHFRKERKK